MIDRSAWRKRWMIFKSIGRTFLAAPAPFILVSSLLISNYLIEHWMDFHRSVEEIIRGDRDE